MYYESLLFEGGHSLQKLLRYIICYKRVRKSEQSLELVVVGSISMLSGLSKKTFSPRIPL